MSLLSSVAAADTFQAEAGLFYNKTDADALASDIKTYGISGSVYFKPVDDSKGPRLEATFLDRASGITATYSDPEGSFDETYSAQGRFVLGNGTILEAGYADMEFEEVYRVGLGTYLSETSAIMLNYTKADNSDVNTLEGSYKAIQKMAGASSLAYTVSAGIVDVPNNGTGYKFGGDVTYYFNQNFGVGILGSIQDLDSGNIETYGVQASYFVAPNFFVQGYYKNAEYNGPDEENFGIGATVRF